MTIPKRVFDRMTKMLAKYQQVLRIAKDRDVNESDTVMIIKDILADVLGYDKYLEVTSEFAIRGTFCDVAVKIDNKIEFLLEAKAIGLELKENHLRQALDYGANNGVQWVVLSNGIVWNIYKIKFEKPIGYDFVCSLNMLELDPKSEQDIEKLFILCKEGIVKDAREEYFEKRQSVNRFVLGELLLRENVLFEIRKQLRKMSEGVPVDIDDIQKVLKNEVIKRDVLEGDEAKKARDRINKFYRKQAKKNEKKVEVVNKEKTDLLNVSIDEANIG